MKARLLKLAEEFEKKAEEAGKDQLTRPDDTRRNWAFGREAAYRAAAKRVREVIEEAGAKEKEEYNHPDYCDLPTTAPCVNNGDWKRCKTCLMNRIDGEEAP